MAGAKLAVMDPRLSNTASMADYWMPTYPGSEAGGAARDGARACWTRRLYDREFVRRWTNWEEYLRAERPDAERRPFENFIDALQELYAEFTPRVRRARERRRRRRRSSRSRGWSARAGPAFSTHIWRGAAAGNLGGWQVARCLFLLNVLDGQRRHAEGGTSPNAWNKFVPVPWRKPRPQKSGTSCSGRASTRWRITR